MHCPCHRQSSVTSRRWWWICRVAVVFYDAHTSGISIVHVCSLYRWNEAFRSSLVNSRVETNKQLVEAIVNAKHRPKVWVSTSAIGEFSLTARACEPVVVLHAGHLKLCLTCAVMHFTNVCVFMLWLLYVTWFWCMTDCWLIFSFTAFYSEVFL